MKNTIYTVALRTFSLILCFVLFAATTNAQTFIPPNAYEDSYTSGSAGILTTTHTSCYSFSFTNFTPLFGISQDLVVSAWDNPAGPATVAWRRIATNNPGFIHNQGTIPYTTGDRDLEVGFMRINGMIKLFVAYHRNGVGHRLDIYNLLPSGPVWSNTVTLSNQAFYSRISMDCHYLYAMVVTWEEAGAVKTKAAWENGTTLGLSPVITFFSTNSQYEPDVAFSHGPLSLMCQYVYSDAGGVITQSSFDFWALTAFTSNTTVMPVIQDVNNVIIPTQIYANIDCPDHGSDDWAYTYCHNNREINVRLDAGAGANTICVNDGSLSNYPTNILGIDSNIAPFLAYSPDGNSFYVGWFAGKVAPQTISNGRYVAVHVNRPGNLLLSPPDYLTIANNPTRASVTPVLSFSKQTDMTNFLYTIFPERITTGYRMEHKYHLWNSVAFKGNREQGLTCNDEARIHKAAAAGQENSVVSVFPNPFSERLRLYIEPGLQDEYIEVSIANLAGQVVYTCRGKLHDINEKFTEKNNIPDGIYLMDVRIPSAGIRKNIKIQKTE